MPWNPAHLACQADLFTPQALYSEKAEMIELSKVVAGKGGVYTTHMRGEMDAVIDSVVEVPIPETREIKNKRLKYLDEIVKVNEQLHLKVAEAIKEGVVHSIVCLHIFEIYTCG